MSRHYAHTLSDGQSIRIRLKRSAKKNLILRPVSRDTVSINEVAAAAGTIAYELLCNVKRAKFVYIQ